MAHMGPTFCLFNKWSCQVFINSRKYKTVFKTRKYHLKIVFFLIANKTSALSKFTSMHDLENNNWFILDSLGNIYEIYPNLTMVTFSNHFWTAQADLCLKDTFVKASFMFVASFSDIYENPKRKNFINPFSHKHPKIINLNKILHKFFYSKLPCGASKRFCLFESPKRSVKTKFFLFFFLSFFLLIRDWYSKG